MDRISQHARSALMSRIRAKDSSPEWRVRRLVHGLGYRFRLHRKDLPGKPDLVFPSRRKIIFVHGCFWHRHPRCPKARLPKSHREYWVPKLRRNRRRDRQVTTALASLGWKSLVVWQCELANESAVAAALRKFLGAQRRMP